MGEAFAYKEYLAGLLAGVATVITGHPFDTVKVKLQIHNTEAHGIKYKNGLHCTTRILQTEGVCSFNVFLPYTVLVKHVMSYSVPASSLSVRGEEVKGLYRGASSSFVGMAFESSLLFGVYSQTKQSLQGGLQGDVPRPQVIIPSAAYSGAIISFLLCPSELVKCRMQIQGTDSLVPEFSRYSSPLDCALQTVKNEGVTGIFRGGFTTLLRESIGNAVFFSVYEYVRHYMHLQLKPTLSDRSNLVDMGIGIVTGGVAVFLPLDVAKTIIQTSPDKSSTRNPFLILNSIYRRAGLKGCYTGLGQTIVRAFPANAAAIVTWELAMKMLGINRD
ncbi:hypothetical protein Peur_016392 [Populus x canadensis]